MIEAPRVSAKRRQFNYGSSEPELMDPPGRHVTGRTKLIEFT
jgi:hypothetical protein